MNIKNIIKYSYPVVYLRILFAKIQEVMPATKYLATAGLRSDPIKMATDLHIRAHALEKGMSIGNVRMGFGKKKALSLINDISRYLEIGGSKKKASDWGGIIESYIKFNEQLGANMNDIKAPFNKLISEHNIQTNTEDAGVLWLNHDDIKKSETAAFSKFSQMRFSVRDFGEAPVSKNKLEDAFKLCERTPSACNRQSWRLHVYTEREQIDKICKLQLGCKGFSEDFQGVILLCTDIRCYAFQEMNQYFVDGGIYAMNLLYALQANDIAAIPLTMGHKTGHLNKIKQEMNLPANEQPILLIGYGSYKDNWKVACSKRDNWESYVSWNI